MQDKTLCITLSCWRENLLGNVEQPCTCFSCLKQFIIVAQTAALGIAVAVMSDFLQHLILNATLVHMMAREMPNARAGLDFFMCECPYVDFCTHVVGVWVTMWLSGQPSTSCASQILLLGLHKQQEQVQ